MPGPISTPPGTGFSGTYYFLDRQIATDAIAYRGVIEGCAVTQQGTPDMSVAISAGEFHQMTPDVANEFYGSGTLTIDASESYQFRIDLITIHGPDTTLGGGVTARVTKGIPDGTPPPPDIPTTGDCGVDIVLAIVVIPPGVTAILDEYIYDRRAILPFQIGAGSTTVAMLDEGAPPSVGNLVGSSFGSLLTDTMIPSLWVPFLPAGFAANNVLAAFTGAGMELKEGPLIRTVRLASDVSVVASTTGIEVTGMQFGTTGTGTFLVVYALRYRSDTASTGIKYALNHTGTAAVLYNSVVPGSSAGAHNQAAAVTNLGGASARAGSTTSALTHSVSVDTVNADMLLWLFALIDVTAGGDLELWTACEVAAGTVTTKAGAGALMVKLV